ncbi:MAG: hypothetical protein IRZ16_19085 [Myxococcaceae bacterium]|nr:hypothetical protein [Myxococcaceae bacterium]
MIAVRLGGSRFPESMESSLAHAEVDLELNLPALAMVEVSADDFSTADWQGLDLRSITLGTALEVAFGNNPVMLFTGAVGELETSLATERTVEFRGFDALYRLQFGTRIQTYEGKTDSEMVQEIALRNGLDAAAEATQVIWPYVLQAGESDFDFLRARAERLHYEFFVQGRTLHFRASREGQAADLTLNWKEEIITLNVVLRALKQGSTVQRTGWNPRQKQSIVATVDNGPYTVRMGGQQTGYELSAVYASSPVSAPDPEIGDPETATTLAAAKWEAGLDGFIEARATVQGDPRLVPGINVRVAGVGPRLSGLYYLTAARHAYSPETGYRTHCTLRRTGA